MMTEIKIWEIQESGKSIVETPQYKEIDVERLVLEHPEILGEDLLIIGEQKTLPDVGRFDLLAIDRNGQLVVIELKRGITPRSVVAQSLDYASWLHTASADLISAIAKKHLGISLQEAFLEEFDSSMPELDPRNHRILIVAAALDQTSERIIQYLVEQSRVRINAIFFKYCELSSGVRILARTALITEVESPGGSHVEPLDSKALDELATKRGVLSFLKPFQELDKSEEFSGEQTTGFGGASIRYWRRAPDTKSRVVFGIALGENKFQTPYGQLDLWIRIEALPAYVKFSADEMRAALKPFDLTERTKKYWTVRLKSEQEAARFASLLLEWMKKGRS